MDTSSLVAIAFEEPGARQLARRLKDLSLFSSNLLEAELRAALLREGVAQPTNLLAAVTWIYPNRALTLESDRILAHGYLKGADLWHLACALFFTREPGEIAFVTLDRRQQEIARALGFQSL